MNIITIIHNQSTNLIRILDAYDNQSIQPIKYIFVLDRCSDNSIEFISNFSKNHNSIIVEINEGNGFQAGRCRDIGLSHIDNDYPVLFLDGDCVPTPKLFEEFQKLLSRNKEIIVVGRRIHEKEFGQDFDDDARVHVPWFHDKIFISGQNNLVKEMIICKGSGLTWSCCLGFNNSAIMKIKNIINDLHNVYRLFSPAFDGCYGGEDDFIGHIAMLFGIDVIGLDPIHNVQHIWHKSREPQNNFTEIVAAEFKKLSEIAMKNNAPGIKYITASFSEYVQNFVTHFKSSIFSK